MQGLETFTNRTTPSNGVYSKSQVSYFLWWRLQILTIRELFTSRTTLSAGVLETLTSRAVFSARSAFSSLSTFFLVTTSVCSVSSSRFSVSHLSFSYKQVNAHASSITHWHSCTQVNAHASSITHWHSCTQVNAHASSITHWHSYKQVNAHASRITHWHSDKQVNAHASNITDCHSINVSRGCVTNRIKNRHFHRSKSLQLATVSFQNTHYMHVRQAHSTNQCDCTEI